MQRSVGGKLVRHLRAAITAVILSSVLTAGEAQSQESTPSVTVLPPVEVIGVTPVQGTGIERSRVPANVQTLDSADIQHAGGPSLADAFERRFGSASNVDSTGNPFASSLNLRGFTASPVLGEPQGIAIYQNGVRLNQPFGDVVLWDMVPTFAVHRAQVIPGSNPVFGLNALGGAVSLEMKNGFNFHGGSLDGSGGSFARGDGTAEYGGQVGNIAYYAGARGFREDGWRDHSPSRLGQSYADIALRKDALDVGASVTFAASDLFGNGPAPEQLLQQDRAAVFTTPDTVRNEVAALALRGAYDVSDTLSLQGNAYYRHVIQHQASGDATGDGPCTGIGGPGTQLCSNPGTPQETGLVDLQGRPVPASIGGTGALNTSNTRTDGLGASLQATRDSQLLGRRNTLILGNALDYGKVRFDNESDIGFLSSIRSVLGSDIFLGGPDFNSRLDAENIYYGLYASDTYALSETWSLTAAGRFNFAALHLRDRFGTALNGDSHFSRFNPSLGVTYQVTPNLNTYANYSEANRIPTAAELACADPTQPCRFPNAFVSDPPLQQVVSRSVETGARGGFVPAGAGSTLTWSAAAFATRNSSDIIFVSSGPVIGSGFFQNAGTTQRLGLELGAEGHIERWTFFANYGLVRATFESALSISSPNNPAADANGNIHVKPGDRIPNIPLQSVKFGLGYALTENWSVAGEWIGATGRFLRGDESNQQSELPSYLITNLESVYKLTPASEVYLRVNNLFDRNYETFGVFGDPTTAIPQFTDRRFVTPSAPRAAWLGARMRF
jgi:iron complex outermembrane recepter protein